MSEDFVLPKTLAAYGKDLTRLAREEPFKPLLGYEEASGRVLRILCRRVCANPLLISEERAKRVAIVRELARQMVQGEVPEDLQDKIVVMLDTKRIVEGIGTLEQRRYIVSSLLDEVAASDGKILLFIDELTRIVSVNGSAIVGPAHFTPRFIGLGGWFQIIGGTTLAALREHIEPNRPFQVRLPAIALDQIDFRADWPRA